MPHEIWEPVAGPGNGPDGVEWGVCEEGGGDGVAEIMPHANQEDRAHLIAAAPTLLAALRLLVCEISDARKYLPADAPRGARHADALVCDAITRAQAAIAAAEGRAA